MMRLIIGFRKSNNSLLSFLLLVSLNKNLVFFVFIQAQRTYYLVFFGLFRLFLLIRIDLTACL